MHVGPKCFWCRTLKIPKAEYDPMSVGAVSLAALLKKTTLPILHPVQVKAGTEQLHLRIQVIAELSVSVRHPATQSQRQRPETETRVNTNTIQVQVSK